MICKQGHTTFTARKGTVFYRLRTPAETVSLGLTLLAQGCPLPALVVAFGCEERTVAAGFVRAGQQAQAVQEHWIEPPRALGQVQAEESRVKHQGKMSWLALALSVGPRLWLAGEVREQRDRGLVRPLLVRVRRCAARAPLLFCTEGCRAYPRALRETFRAPLPTGRPGRPRGPRWQTLPIAQVVKPYTPRRRVRVERRILRGTAAQVEKRRRRSQGGDGVSNTASSERLHAPFRERLAPLTRRGRARARRTSTRHAGM